MAELLIVDDSEFDRSIVRKVVRSLGSWKAEFATSGAEAMQRLSEREFDLLLTDLHMPSMTGLDLLASLRFQQNDIPVVIMTSRGNEDMAVQALRGGATNYVIKKQLVRDLPGIIESVMRARESAASSRALLEGFELADYRFTISNDPGLRPAAIAFIQDAVRRFGHLGESDLTRLGIALEEALANAVIHGNLEVSSDLREDGCDVFEDMIEHRRQLNPWRDRRVTVTVQFRSDVLTCAIEDEGPGFDPESVPDATDPANLNRASGRGLLLIRSFVDTVHHNEQGNCITLIKRLVPDKPTEDSASQSELCTC